METLEKYKEIIATKSIDGTLESVNYNGPEEVPINILNQNNEVEEVIYVKRHNKLKIKCREILKAV
jgi:hypothetical protein